MKMSFSWTILKIWNMYHVKRMKFENFHFDLQLLIRSMSWWGALGLPSMPPSLQWLQQRGNGESPPNRKKIVVEKQCYFSEVYKMEKVQEDVIENG